MILEEKALYAFIVFQKFVSFIGPNSAEFY